MPVAVALWGVAALFAVAVLAVLIHRTGVAGRLIYLLCLVACLANLGVAGMQLLAGAGAGYITGQVFNVNGGLYM